MKQIKCVIFDFGGVIGLPQSAMYIEEMVSLTGVNREILMPKYFRHRSDYDQGFTDSLGYWTLILEGQSIQLTPELVDQLRLADAASWTQINPKMIDFIQQLKLKGVRIALLSNINTGVVPYIEEKFEWMKLFDDIFYSCDLQLLKPSIEIYEHVVRTLGITASDCLFIDDSLENIHGAISVGMAAAQYIEFDAMIETIQGKYII